MRIVHVVRLFRKELLALFLVGGVALSLIGYLQDQQRVRKLVHQVDDVGYDLTSYVQNRS